MTLYVRVQEDNVRKEFSTGLFIAKVNFNGAEIVGLPNSLYLNIKLNKILTGLQKLIEEKDIKNQDYNVHTLVAEYLTEDKKYITVKALTDEYDKERKADITIKKSTQVRDKCCKDMLYNYIKHIKQEHIPLFQINNSWGTNYINWICLQTHSNGTNYNAATINKFRSYLQRCIKYAMGKDYITHNLIEASKIMPQKRKELVSLDDVELANWENYHFASDKLQRVADLFTFQCHTGFDYGDLCTFDYEKHTDTKNNRLVIRKPRNKNGQIAFLPLDEQAIIILKKYNYSLPIISDQKYNVYLRECAEVVGINKHLTSHIGRKTFANINVNYKMYSVDTASKMLGHNNILTTQKHYVNVNEHRVMQECTPTQNPRPT